MPAGITLSSEPKQSYSDSYKDIVYLVWWKNSKPNIAKLRNLIPEDVETESKPSEQTLKRWVREIFVPRAVDLDNQFYDQVQEIAIQQKVEMLQRHSQIAETMIDIAQQYIVEHKTDLSMNSAIRLLVEGVRIERDSKGVPDALQKMAEMTDDELLDEVKKILSESGGNLLPSSSDE